MREKNNYINCTRGTQVMMSIRKLSGIFIIIFAIISSGCEKNVFKQWATDPLISGVDAIPPAVSSLFPANNALAVVRSTNVSVTFSEYVNPASVNMSTFNLSQGTNAVAGTINYTGSTATFTPAESLAANTVYTASVTSGVKDVAGNSLKADSTWSFTTEAAPDNTAPTVVSVAPANSATSVNISSPVTITFSEAMNPTTISSSAIVLKQGSVVVGGTLVFTGTVATFTPSSALIGNKVYTVLITTGVADLAGNQLKANYTWTFTTLATVDVTPPVVNSVTPASNAASIATNAKPTVLFSEAMNPATITSSTFTLKKGTTAVTGTVSYSGTTATFSPSSDLLASTAYTGTITTGAKDAAGNAIASAYTWNFTTGAVADVTPPTVVSSVPVNSATSVAVNGNLTITFSEAMSSASLTASTFTLKQGSTSIPGTVSYTGVVATFTPSSDLAGSTSYTATITTGAKDLSGNALTSAYTWSFTTIATGDVTPPAIVSVSPAANSTGIAVNSKTTVTFSEAMASASFTSSTFTLKQGTIAVSGSITYSGTTATFTPSADLAGSTIYTATVTTGVKDVAGNQIASSYSWNFTTVASAPAGKSFSADVMPILGICNTCHTHGWTTSSNGSTFYTNLVNGGYVNPTTPTSGKIYTKLNGGHPGSTVTTAQVNTILTWITEGSKNN